MKLKNMLVAGVTVICLGMTLVSCGGTEDLTIRTAGVVLEKGRKVYILYGLSGEKCAVSQKEYLRVDLGEQYKCPISQLKE